MFSITPQQINNMRNKIEDAFKRFAGPLRRPGKVHNHAFATTSSQPRDKTALRVFRIP